jgi:hypothetical protein
LVNVDVIDNLCPLQGVPTPPSIDSFLASVHGDGGSRHAMRYGSIVPRPHWQLLHDLQIIHGIEMVRS